VRIAALVKQIPTFEEMTLGPDGRLVREGIELEMSAYCRRAVSKAVELATGRPGSTVTVVTLGPPSAHDVLREAIAWGLERGVEIEGVHVCDPAFAGSDTLATAHALAAALRRAGPFELVLSGRNSVDADTGQVPPQVAELLDLPFATGVKTLALDGDVLTLGCEHDDQWVDCEIELPALLSCAERLCEPSKVPPEGRAAVPAERIRVVRAADLGPGPWGAGASPTTVGATRVLAVDRQRHVRADAPLAEQVRDAVRILHERGALDGHGVADDGAVPAVDATGGAGPVVAVVAEPDRDRLLHELLGAAATLAAALGGSTVAVTTHSEPDARALGAAGADRVVRIDGARAEEDVAAGVAAWAGVVQPWAILAGSTAFGREVAGRVAARLGAGLTGDAVALEADGGRLVAWKPAFGGQLVAAIQASSAIQMATVRAGVLPHLAPRALPGGTPPVEVRHVEPRDRVLIRHRRREDDIDILAEAEVVVGVGRGVDPVDYPALTPLTSLLGAEIGCTRKVTDNGWMPHARQIGITGRSIAPRLYVMIGASGKFNHTVGVRAAGTVLAIDRDPGAQAWQHADVGIVGDWKEALPLLVAELRAALEPATS
jgi:electron transfer flavoprotein alpha subunit